MLSEKAVPVLEMVLSDKNRDYRVRRNAAEALGKIGSAASVETLRWAAGRDKSKKVKDMCVWALERIGVGVEKVEPRRVLEMSGEAVDRLAETIVKKWSKNAFKDMPLPTLIAITGYSAAGKTHFSKKFIAVIQNKMQEYLKKWHKEHPNKRLVSPKVLTIDFDDYIMAKSDRPTKLRSLGKMGSLKPEEWLGKWEFARFYQDVQALRRGQVIHKPVFDQITRKRKTDAKGNEDLDTIYPGYNIIIVEGIFSLSHKQTNRNYDLTVFLDGGWELRRNRDIQRYIETGKYYNMDVLEVEKQFIRKHQTEELPAIQEEMAYAEVILSTDNIPTPPYVAAFYKAVQSYRQWQVNKSNLSFSDKETQLRRLYQHPDFNGIRGSPIEVKVVTRLYQNTIAIDRPNLFKALSRLVEQQNKMGSTVSTQKQEIVASLSLEFSLEEEDILALKHSLENLRAGQSLDNGGVCLSRAEFRPQNIVLFGVSGGDCPGLNSALSAAAEEAFANGLELYALVNGLEAVCAEPEYFLKRIIKVIPELAVKAKAWGSILSGSSRTNLTDKDAAKQAKKQANAIANCQSFKGVVMVGGDDHAKQSGVLADILKPYNVPVAIIPKSIDFDCHTLMLGPSTAIEWYQQGFWSSALSAKVHTRSNVYEFMGRDRSWLTLLGSYGYPEVFYPENLPAGYSIQHPYQFVDLKRGLQNSIGQTQGSVLRLIAERPAFLRDIMLAALRIMLREELIVEGEALIDGTGNAVKALPRLYVNFAVSEGFSFQDTKVEAYRKNKNTLFYRLLDLSKKWNIDFFEEIEFDEHGNPKFSGIGQYLQFALTQLPQLAQFDQEVNALYQQLIQAAIITGKKSIFKEAKREAAIITTLNGPRYSLPGFELRGHIPNKRDQLLGDKFGRKAVQLILEKQSGLEVNMPRYAEVETTEPDVKPVKEVAVKESVVDIYEEGKVSVKGVHTDKEIAAAGVLTASANQASLDNGGQDEEELNTEEIIAQAENVANKLREVCLRDQIKSNRNLKITSLMAISGIALVLFSAVGAEFLGPFISSLQLVFISWVVWIFLDFLKDSRKRNKLSKELEALNSRVEQMRAWYGQEESRPQEEPLLKPEYELVPVEGLSFEEFKDKQEKLVIPEIVTSMEEIIIISMSEISKLEK
ncbi:MAG: 6-phosphofructokinase, partial [Candidatus Omnitrophota bacterium]